MIKTKVLGRCTTYPDWLNIVLAAAMRLSYVVPVFFAILVILGGCRSTSPATEASADGAPADTLYTRAVHVLVDGKDRGVVPQTLRIRRSFGTEKVSLWQAGDEIRVYEIELSNTSAGEQLMQGFWSSPSSDGASYDVQTLPKGNDITYRIPYSDYPLRIEDNEYGVTLLVSN